MLIKRTDSTGDWYFWDTARGIVSGDPSTKSPTLITLTRSIGFTVTSNAPAALNASGGTYIFLDRLMQRPDPMIAGKPGAEDVQAMMARTLWLEELFFLDGRDQISHPQHGLFTGLALKYQSLGVN